MADNSRLHCSYQHQLTEAIRPSPLVGVPSDLPEPCSHHAVDEDGTRCMFHSEAREFPPSALSEAFTDAITEPTPNANFAGGRLGALDLSDKILDATGTDPIDLREAEITGDLDLTDTTLSAPLLLGGATINGSLIVENSRFEAPVDFSGLTVSKGLHARDAMFEAGLAANGFDVSYTDARGMHVSGPAIFNNANFKVNCRFARATFDDQVSFDRATWGLLCDFTAVTINGPASFAKIEVGGELRFINATVAEEFALTGASIDDKTALQHASVTGDLKASDVTFGAELDCDDLYCAGDIITFRGSHFRGYTSFSLARFDVPKFDFSDAVFDDELWFVHGRFTGDLDGSNTQYNGDVHFRDAYFEGSVTITNACFVEQAFFHESTINGNLHASSVAFESHFQFSATVTGTVDFSHSHFDNHSTFRNGEVAGDTRFDEATFAGNADFSDTRFKSSVSFDHTVFLTQPDFEGTRFAVTPNFETTEQPHPEAMTLTDNRRIVVARPEKLLNNGLKLTLEAVMSEPKLTPNVAHLVNLNPSIAAWLAHQLKEMDGADWHDLSSDALELARTATAQIDSPLEQYTVLVFGYAISQPNPNTEPELDSFSLVGVYSMDPDHKQVRFAHLIDDFDEIDHVVPVPAVDEAFESGPSVGTRTEYKEAIYRRQGLQAALLKQGVSRDKVTAGFVPVLVAAGESNN